MRHRHLNHDELTPAAIDSIIERGAWCEWLRLARATRNDADIAGKVVTLTASRLNNLRDDELNRALFTRWQSLAVRSIRHLEMYDPVLRAAKDENQARSRQLVRDGVRKPEGNFFISPEVVKTLKIRHRTDEF